MKYETPELTALDSINAIQSNGAKTAFKVVRDFMGANETHTGYADWE